ncbi:MAG: flagellar hook-basal body complex protein FliE [Oscillospiraceae bacterium]|nr:flagellar hook-basal body complex protein FliE [Oscillospiraceae bacterium]
MNISAITGISNLFPSNALFSATSSLAAEGNEKTGASFRDIFQEAIDNAAKTDAADKIGQVELLTGQSDDFAGLLINSEKANIALSLTVQLRNKVLESYNEIMRMSV